MPYFTIEKTYRLPVYQHKTYEAATVADACRLAIEDDDWENEKHDYESAGETYITGVWSGTDAAYSGPARPIPSHYTDVEQRIARHFEVLLGLLKLLATHGAPDAVDRTFWHERAELAIAKAEAILERRRAPDDAST
jgi:hypothetical protein